MAGSTVDFDDDDAKVIAFLVDHFDKKGEWFSLGDMQVDVPREKIVPILERFNRYTLVKCETLGRDVWSIQPQLLSVAEQLSAPPPPRDYWKDVETWFRGRWWSLPVLLVFVGIPIIVTYIQMLVTILKWLGVVGSE